MKLEISFGVFFFLSITLAGADTVHLTSEDAIKGLVVEDHHDRIVFSTEEGERVIMKDVIRHVEYDDPEYSLLSLARRMEKKKRWAEAISFYERALKRNPELREAKDALLGVKNKQWAKITEGPVGEVAKQQAMQDAWRTNVGLGEVPGEKVQEKSAILWERAGLEIASEGDWVRVKRVKKGGPADKQGLKKKDALVSIDGRSLRFMNQDAVEGFLLRPRFSNAQLRIHRVLEIPKPKANSGFKEIGMKVELKYNGLTVTEVKEGMPVEGAGVHFGDLLVEIHGYSTRYMPYAEAIRLVEREGSSLVLKLNRVITLTRN